MRIQDLNKEGRKRDFADTLQQQQQFGPQSWESGGGDPPPRSTPDVYVPSATSSTAPLQDFRSGVGMTGGKGRVGVLAGCVHLSL